MKKALLIICIAISSLTFGVDNLEVIIDSHIFDINSNITTKSIELSNKNDREIDLLITCWKWDRENFNNSKITDVISINKDFVRIPKHSKKVLEVSYTKPILDNESFYFIKIGQSKITSKKPYDIPNTIVPITVKNTLLDQQLTIRTIIDNNDTYLIIKNEGNEINLESYTIYLKENNKILKSFTHNVYLKHNEETKIPIKHTKLSNNLFVEFKKG